MKYHKYHQDKAARRLAQARQTTAALATYLIEMTHRSNCRIDQITKHRPKPSARYQPAPAEHVALEWGYRQGSHSLARTEPRSAGQSEADLARHDGATGQGAPNWNVLLPMHQRSEKNPPNLRHGGLRNEPRKRAAAQACRSAALPS